MSHHGGDRWLDRCCLRSCFERTNAREGTLLITADHGNAEVMESSDAQGHAAPTTNPVPGFCGRRKAQIVCRSVPTPSAQKRRCLADVPPILG